MWSLLRASESRGAAFLSSRCYSSVVAWGSNSQGQCGVPSFNPVVLAPEEIESLSALPLTTLAAGSTHSAAVTSNGDVYTFGAGSKGQLGLGQESSSYSPNRVESLVGSAKVQNTALGHQHTLFLDASGLVHACGTSPEFQAADNGSGSSSSESGVPKDLADLLNLFTSGSAPSENSRSALESDRKGRGFTVSSMARRARGTAIAGHADALSSAQSPAGNHHQRVSSAAAVGWETMQLVPIVDHSARFTELQNAILMYDDGMHSAMAKDSAGTAWDATWRPESSMLRGVGSGTEEGSIQYALPLKLRDAAKMHMDGGVRFSSLSCCAETGAGVVLSSLGVPYTLQPRNGHRRRHASRQLLQGPSPLLAAALERNGGATAVAAGSGFYAALTASGSVLVWSDTASSESAGAVGAGADAGGSEILLESSNKESTVPWAGGILRAQGTTVLLEFTGLPAMTTLSAGSHAVVMSDGRSVWSLTIGGGGGSQLPSPAQVHAGIEGAGSLNTVERVLTLGDEGVASLAAGGGAAAVISGAGRLWLWGNVLSVKDAQQELVRAEQEGFGHWAFSSTANYFSAKPAGFGGPGEGSWPGLRSSVPAVVPGLHNVMRIALGRGHALAEIA